MVRVNRFYIGANGRKSTYDVHFVSQNKKLQVVVFAHGYKGFKDWGCWNLVAEAFAKKGFLFVKLNFSHNGTTATELIDFPDLQAFGENRYSYELHDIGAVIHEITSSNTFENQAIDTSGVALIGHSRGGGIVALASNKYSSKVHAFATWAGVSDFASRFPLDKEKWKNEGVIYVANGRTKQQMPHFYSFYQDFVDNQKALDISNALRHARQKCLVIYAENDEAVLPKEAMCIHDLAAHSTLLEIKNTGHTFGSKHPYEKDVLPEALQQVVHHTIAFFYHLIT